MVTDVFDEISFLRGELSKALEKADGNIMNETVTRISEEIDNLLATYYIKVAEEETDL